MIIKFSDNFNSIFYAVLYSNLSGYYLSAKNQSVNLLSSEEALDVDQLNFQQILEEHDQLFGPLHWLDNTQQLAEFMNLINLALRFWKDVKYVQVVDLIKIAIKFGLTYAQYNSLAEYKAVHECALAVLAEKNSALGKINFLALNFGLDRFLVGSLDNESAIGDLVISDLSKKYLQHNLIIKTRQNIYLYYRNRPYTLPVSQYDLDFNSKSLSGFIERFSKELFLSITKVATT